MPCSIFPCASMPSGPGAGCNDWVDFAGIQRTHAAHVSTADPEPLLVCRGRGQSTVLALLSHPNGLRCDSKVTVADGIAIRDAALEMGIPIVILAADRGCNAQGFPVGNGCGHR